MHAARCFTAARVVHAVWQLALPSLRSVRNAAAEVHDPQQHVHDADHQPVPHNLLRAADLQHTTKNNKRLLWHKPNTEQQEANRQLPRLLQQSLARSRSICNEQRYNARTSLQHAPCNSRPAESAVDRPRRYSRGSGA
jgi:hypothetical protein